MDKTNLPIAVFDSGLGGISVLKELVSLMPEENYIYFGDSLNAPYGHKSSEQVSELTIVNIDYLLAKPVKAVVLACNTATSAAVAILRDKYRDIPIIGMEPALKPAIINHLGGRILVLATAMTLREKKFADLLDKYRDQAQIVTLPAPGIVELVEQGITEGAQMDDYLTELLAPYRQPKINGIVLGCTHFPFVKSSILAALGYEAPIYDGVLGTAMETKRQLDIGGLANPQKQNGEIEFINSKNDYQLIKLSEQLFNI